MLTNKSNSNINKTNIIYKMNKLKNKKFKLLFYSFCIIVIDQISKFLILRILRERKTINIIPSLLDFTLAKNKGAAFSLFSNSTALLTITSIFASLLLITFIIKSPPRSYWNSMGVSFLLGGTVGNGIDRLFKGYVLDFFDLAHTDFPIFNIADISINIAIVCFIIDQIRSKYKSRFLLKNK